jgi:hypothetical protein
VDQVGLKKRIAAVKVPDSKFCLADFNFQLNVQENRILITLPFPFTHYQTQLHNAVKVAVTEKIDIKICSKISSYLPQMRPGLRPVAHVKNIIAIASGKGGVGKSTVAANVGFQLQRLGARVGILDADIHGPSQDIMLGLENQKQRQQSGEMFEALENKDGLKVMSIAFLIDKGQAIIWRGPMLSKALQQLLFFTRWGSLDYLIIDLPPGTGDVQLTLVQKIPLSAAVVVTTPQVIALIDAARAVQMFEKVQVPVVGIIENMSYFKCSHCDHREYPFGQGGGEHLAAQCHIPLLGKLPLATSIREAMDRGDISHMQPYWRDYQNITWQMVLSLAQLSHQ